MSSSFSIAEAKSHLPKLVHEAETGQFVEITRRGRPVAVILSIQEFRRLSADKLAFWIHFESFREQFELESIEPEEWLGDGVRAVSGPRDFSW